MSNSLRRFVSLLALFALCHSATGSDLTLIGTHPTSPLTRDPQLHSLKAFEGRIYMGYGEWAGYPVIVVASYDPASHSIQLEHSAPTDSIPLFREIAGRLYLPSADPIHYDDFHDYSVLERGIWRNFRPFGLVHVFDMNTLTGRDLWMVGSKPANETQTAGAVALRSLDGGRTWRDVTRRPVVIDRYYWSMTHGDRLYVEDSYFIDDEPLPSAPQPELIWKTTPYAGATQPLTLALSNRTAGLNFGAPNRLISFDGTSWTGRRSNVYDFAVVGSDVYTLELATNNGTNNTALWVGTSIGNPNPIWTQLPINSALYGRSIEVLNDIIYVGDHLGQLWAGRIDGAPLQLGPAATVNKMPDAFGRALSVDGSRLLVGAPEHSGAAYLSGQVTLWQQSGSQWTRTQTIDPPEPIFSGLFGKDVAIAGPALAVLEGGVRGDLATVHLYHEAPAGWALTQSLVHPFAHSLALTTNRLAVATETSLSIYTCGLGTNGAAATLETNLFHNISFEVLYEPTGRAAMDGDVIAYGIAGDFSRQGGPGQVNIYERNTNGAWINITNLLQNTPPLPTGLTRQPDAFGFALALQDNCLVVGAPRDDTAALQAGAVYIYERLIATNGTPVYTARQKIVSPFPQAEARFGESLSLAGSHLVIGAPGIDQGPIRQRGSAFIYKHDGTNWTLLGQVKRPDHSQVGFGFEVFATTNLVFTGSRTTARADDISRRLGISAFPDEPRFADLSIAHAVSATTVSNGAPLTYSLTVSNSGPAAATEVRLAFAVPPNLQIQNISSAAFACTNNGFEVWCSLDALASGSGASVVLTSQASNTNLCDSIRLAADVWSAEIDPVLSNNATVAMVNYDLAAVTIAEPADGAEFPFASSIRITAASPDPGDILHVSIYANSNRLAVLAAAPYTWVWTNVPAGTHDLTLRTRTTCDVSTSAVTRIVVRGNVPPNATFLHPAAGTRIAEGTPVRIIVDVSDEDTPPGRLWLFANNAFLANFPNPPYNSYVWSNAPLGTCILSARAHDSGSVQLVSFAHVRVRVGAGFEEPGTTNWVAYNDHNPGPQTAITVSGWNIPTSSLVSTGVLRNVSSGATVPAFLTISRSPRAPTTNAAAEPNPGTPASDIFSGFIDFTAGPVPNVALAGNEWGRYTFTGLDPNYRYNFRGTAIGGIADHTNRWTFVELRGTRSFQNSHTVGCLTQGVGTIQSNQVAFNSGDNRAGEVVGWDNIRPAPDGSIMIECRQYSGTVPGGTSSGANAFALTAIRLEEVVVPVDPAPVIQTQPVPTAVSIGGSVQLTAAVTTQTPVTYQWLRNGIILPDQTNAVLHLAGISTNDAGSYILIVTGDTGSAASNPAALTVMKIAVDQSEPQPRARIDIHGPPRQTYTIQKKDVLSETLPWTDLSTITVTNARTFIDQTSQSVPTRFYQIIPVP